METKFIVCPDCLNDGSILCDRCAGLGKLPSDEITDDEANQMWFDFDYPTD